MCAVKSQRAGGSERIHRHAERFPKLVDACRSSKGEDCERTRDLYGRETNARLDQDGTFAPLVGEAWRLLRQLCAVAKPNNRTLNPSSHRASQGQASSASHKGRRGMLECSLAMRLERLCCGPRKSEIVRRGSLEALSKLGRAKVVAIGPEI